MGTLIIQIFLFILSVSAMFLISRTESWKKWGYPIGLASQPFWIISSVQNETWGILALSCCYTITWIMGIYNYFIKGKSKKEIWSDLLFWNDKMIWKEKK